IATSHQSGGGRGHSDNQFLAAGLRRAAREARFGADGAVSPNRRGDHMKLPDISRLSRRFTLAGVALIAALSAGAPPARAKVTQIVIDTRVSPAFGGATFGNAGQYETLAGRVFGELDPFDKHNEIINDLELAPRNSRGKV